MVDCLVMYLSVGGRAPFYLGKHLQPGTSPLVVRDSVAGPCRAHFIHKSV